jgi:hypothetical protein
MPHFASCPRSGLGEASVRLASEAAVRAEGLVNYSWVSPGLARGAREALS